MGCGVSNVVKKSKVKAVVSEEKDFKVSSCKLSFTHRQMDKLNQKFANLLECYPDSHKGHTKEKHRECISVVVERLVQRLICNVGVLDPRFSSKFLINLEPLKSYAHEPRKSLKFKYLVRLDLVSTPALYPEFFEPPVQIKEGIDHESVPQGYAKIKVHGEFLEHWIGFISPNGFLRRDKIQERFVELLARAAARPTDPISPDQVDESKHCGSPGKIVDPVTLCHILRTSPSQQVFFGSAECNEARFPDPRDFRIAIVEGVPETRLHIFFLSPTAQAIIAEEDVEISITVGVGVSGWPVTSDYPHRLPLDHVDVILGYQAAQLDYYLVPKGPHSSIHCEDRYSIWEIRTLATEMFLEHHYSPTSVVVRVHKILLNLLEILKARGVKTINRYIVKNLLFFELENKKGFRHWTPSMISRRVLSILDRLLTFLRNQMVPSYIFTEKNLLLQEGTLEDDYISDADILENYIQQLYNDGFKVGLEDIDRVSIQDQMDNAMLQKWVNVLTNLLPPMSNRSRRLSIFRKSSASISYTRQQMEYVALLLKEILKVKNIQRRNLASEFGKRSENWEEGMVGKEDFIYLLQIIFEQAKQKLLSSVMYRTQSKGKLSKRILKSDQVVVNYDISTAMLVDEIRRNRQGEYCFEDDMALVVKLMECLYKAIDSDGRVLGPVLRPYLSQLFKGSHENCWFLFEWNRRTNLSEFQAIGAFSSLVLSKSIDPLDGIINSANKGWNWANNCLQILQAIREENSTRIVTGEKTDLSDSGLRLIFTPAPGKTIRFNISSTAPIGLDTGPEQTTMKRFNTTTIDKSGGDSRYATIKSFQEILNSAISSGEIKVENNTIKIQKSTTPKSLPPKVEKHLPHTRLKNGNPFTIASMEVRRQGNHRGLGSIVQALISLQKLTILQEISQYLPDDERTRVLGDIKKLSKEVQRLAVENYRKKKTLSLAKGKNRFSFKKSASSLPSRLSNQRRKIVSLQPKVSELEGRGVYRSVSEFNLYTQEQDLQNEVKPSEEKKKQKEDTLLGTCRQLRREYRPTVFDNSLLYTPPKTGRYKRPSTMPKSVINTPFYIKVSSYNSRVGETSTSVLKTSKL